MAVGFGYAREDASRTRSAGRHVELVGVNEAIGGIGEVEGAAVVAPFDAVGDHEPGGKTRHRKIGIQSVKMSGGVPLGVVHGAGPESPERIDVAVVEAVVRKMPLR